MVVELKGRGRELERRGTEAEGAGREGMEGLDGRGVGEELVGEEGT